MIEKRQNRYAITIIEKLLARLEHALAQQYARTEREDTREQIRFLIDLRDRYEGK
jgi:hypothetical protein